MPTGKVNGSKFFGEERYQQYVDELTADGTLDGEQLSSEERKEGFKKRNDKIGFQEFVENVLERKKSADVSKSAGELPGEGKGGALVKVSKSNLKEETGITKLDPDKVVPPESAGGNVLGEILEIVTSIRDTLLEKEKRDKGRAKEERQSAERKKRSKKEKGLESNIFKGLAKTTEKVLAPVKGLFEKIFDFIKTVLLGSIVVNILKWMGDPENKEKVDNLLRFLTDFFPAIATAFILFGTKFGGLIRLLGGWALKIIKFAVPKLLRFIRRKPKAVAALAVVGGVGMLGARILTGTEIDGSEDEGSPSPEEMSNGGVVPGSGNKDTVPAMLTPGEFVLSKGAVNKFGRGTLESMNAMGGGSGIPSFSDGIMYAKTGGHVPGSDEDKERPKFDPKAVSKMLSDTYGVDSSEVKVPTITASAVKGKKDDKEKQGGGGSLKGLTGQDYRDLAFIVSAEAQRGTDDEYGVAAAVLNRVADPAWPNNIAAVGSQAGQFEAVYKGLAKDDPELATKLGSAEGQAKIVEALKMLKGRTDFKGTSQYGNMGDGDVKFSDRGNFYHYKEQVGKTDPPPSPIPTFYKKFIGTGGPAVTLSGTKSSGSSVSRRSGSSSGKSGSTSSDISSTDIKAFDFRSMRQALGVKTGSVSKSSRPSSSTMAYQQMLQGQSQGDGSGMTGQGVAPGVPQFDAAAMSSNKKIKVLGITV
tara:strand:+ start:672 stop:2768 length:2097 start_codon:yes stop_codon:yes gene_type:complete